MIERLRVEAGAERIDVVIGDMGDRAACRLPAAPSRSGRVAAARDSV
jgi:hypothetical protein